MNYVMDCHVSDMCASLLSQFFSSVDRDYTNQPAMDLGFNWGKVLFCFACKIMVMLRGVARQGGPGVRTPPST